MRPAAEGSSRRLARHSRVAAAPCHIHAAAPSSFSQRFSSVIGMLARPVLTLLVVAGAAAATPPRPSTTATRNHHHRHHHQEKEDAVDQTLDKPPIVPQQDIPTPQLVALALLPVVVVCVGVSVCWYCTTTTSSPDFENSPLTERKQSPATPLSPASVPSPDLPHPASPGPSGAPSRHVSPPSSSFSSSSTSSSVSARDAREAQVVPICTYLTPTSPDAPRHSLRDPFHLSTVSRSP